MKLTKEEKKELTLEIFKEYDIKLSDDDPLWGLFLMQKDVISDFVNLVENGENQFEKKIFNNARKAEKILNGAVEILEISNQKAEKNRNLYQENINDIKGEIRHSFGEASQKSINNINHTFGQYLPKKVFIFILITNIIMLISNGIGLFFILKFFKYI